MSYAVSAAALKLRVSAMATSVAMADLSLAVNSAPVFSFSYARRAGGADLGRGGLGEGVGTADIGRAPGAAGLASEAVLGSGGRGRRSGGDGHHEGEGGSNGGGRHERGDGAGEDEPASAALGDVWAWAEPLNETRETPGSGEEKSRNS